MLLRIPLFLFVFIISISSCNSPSKKHNTENLSWMTKISNIEIPAGSKNIILYNNHEWGMITKFKLDSLNFELFASKNNLTSLNPSNFKMQLLNDIENIDTYENFIKDNKDYIYFDDCETGNSWSVLGNKKTGEIWFEVLYPDYGGDIAPCNKNKIDNTL